MLNALSQYLTALTLCVCFDRHFNVQPDVQGYACYCCNDDKFMLVPPKTRGDKKVFVWKNGLLGQVENPWPLFETLDCKVFENLPCRILQSTLVFLVPVQNTS